MPHLLLVPSCELNRIKQNRDRCLDLTVMSSIGDKAKENARGTGKATRLEPIMLKNLPIIPSQTSQKFYPLFLIYSQIITYYSFIILSILLVQ